MIKVAAAGESFTRVHKLGAGTRSCGRMYGREGGAGWCFGGGLGVGFLGGGKGLRLGFIVEVVELVCWG